MVDMTNIRSSRADDEHGEASNADVVVVGARCAGAATAMLLAAAGHDVVVVDRAVFPSDTLSTHAIARTGVVQLHRWGLLGAVVDSGAPPIREVRFHAETTVVRTIKDRHGVDHLVAPRRQVLDRILQDAARASGATIRTGITVDGVDRAAGRVQGVSGHDADGRPVRFGARIVIGADGLRSRVARCVRAPMIDVRRSSGATHYAYFSGDWEPMEYYLGDGAFAGIFPTHDGQACIWVCSSDQWAIDRRRRHSTLEEAFDEMVADAAPCLAERLRHCTRMSGVRGMVRTPNHVRLPVGPGWALVGDAGYHRDAITGHGISDAFRDAELLAAAVDPVLRGAADERDALAAYHHGRDLMIRDIFEITCELSEFPPPARFAQLQKQLSAAIDDQSAQLAARPVPATALVAA
jgi:flavin-dependent dehydrogenase